MVLRVRAVALDTHRGPRGLAPEHALLVVLDLDVACPPRGGSPRPARARRSRGRPRPSSRHRTACPGRSACARPDRPRTGRGWQPPPGARAVRGSAARCSRPFRSGSTTPCSTASGSMRSSASSRYGAFTATISRDTGSTSCSTITGRTFTGLEPFDSSVIPESAMRPTISGVPTQIVRWCASESRTANVPPTAPGPRMATVLVMRALDRRSGSRSSSRNTRPAPRSLPRANRFPSP